MNVVVTLRGKKYELAATTVEELQREMEARSGLKPGQQVRGRDGEHFGRCPGGRLSIFLWTHHPWHR